LRKTALTPAPRISVQSKSSTSATPRLAIAWLIGWEEFRARAAANPEIETCSFAAPVLPDSALGGPVGIADLRVAGSHKLTTLGLPAVNVPVLSNSTAVMLPAFSNATPSRMRIPRCAAAFEPAMMAAGVAKPIAQGQAMIRTEAAMITAAARDS